MPIQRPSLTVQEIAEQIDLTIGVYDTSSARFVHNTTCKSQVVPAPLLILTKDSVLVSVEGSTRLSAVRWTIAGSLEEPLRGRVRQDGQFVIHQDSTPCDLHETVSQCAGSSRKCMLRLTI